MNPEAAKPHNTWDDSDRLLAALFQETCRSMGVAGISSLHIEGQTILVQMVNGKTYGPINILRP